MNNFIDTIPTIYLVISLVILLVASAFFSGSETAMMALNRYKLKHLTKTSKHARRVYDLISKPDRLLAAILICNNFVNIYAATIAALIGAKLFGEKGATIYAPIALTIILLLFGEITPKTLAATHSQKIAFITSIPLKFILWILSPIIKVVSFLSNSLLHIVGAKKITAKSDALTIEELHTVVNEASARVSDKHKEMLTNILSLDKMTINDIMIPRLDIIGIDINDKNENIVKILKSLQHTLIPVYDKDINKIIGILHSRDLASNCVDGNFNIEKVKSYLLEPYFIPEGTSLYQQLINFQRNKSRMALVVDEYGDVQGIITLADILEEIVGQFTTDISDLEQDIFYQQDGSLLVNASISIRELNQILNWKLPIGGAKTLSGLIIEYLEFIPEPNTCVSINNYRMEVMQIQDKIIKTVKFY